MICFPINLSTAWTRFYYMSNMIDFMDTFFERVHVGVKARGDTREDSDLDVALLLKHSDLPPFSIEVSVPIG